MSRAFLEAPSLRKPKVQQLKRCATL